MEPDIKAGGVSIAKRCLQLFDPQYMKKLDKRATIVIDKEMKSKKVFQDFSTLKKLKIFDEERPTKTIK